KSESSRLFSCVRVIHARGSADCSLECNERAKPCTRNLPLQEDYCGTLRFFAVRTQQGFCSFCGFFFTRPSQFGLVRCHAVTIRRARATCKRTLFTLHRTALSLTSYRSFARRLANRLDFRGVIATKPVIIRKATFGPKPRIAPKRQQ